MLAARTTAANNPRCTSSQYCSVWRAAASRCVRGTREADAVETPKKLTRAGPHTVVLVGTTLCTVLGRTVHTCVYSYVRDGERASETSERLERRRRRRDPRAVLLVKVVGCPSWVDLSLLYEYACPEDVRSELRH